MRFAPFVCVHDAGCPRPPAGIRRGPSGQDAALPGAPAVA
jgi:hypothetical protein